MNFESVNSEIDTIDNNSLEETESNVYIPTNKEIEDTINYGEVKNTTRNTQFWLKVLTDIRTKMGYNYDIDKSPYAPTSIKNCFAAICRYLWDNSNISPVPDLYDEPINGLTITIPCEKNNAGGFKDLNNSGRVIDIPPDNKRKLIPVSDVINYISKRPQGFK
ncbi:5490_t:CDS:2, partial [Entrophospora sp. SA101]